METSGERDGSLSLNTDIVRKILVNFLRDETRNAGFTKGILGLSGGVDSAVCAFLAAEALGKENVRGVIMPSEIVLVTDADRDDLRRREAEILAGLEEIEEKIEILGAEVSRAVKLLIEAEGKTQDVDLRDRIRAFLDEE